MEMQKWKLLHVVGYAQYIVRESVIQIRWPTDDEIEKAKHPFYRWIILTLIILFVIAIDHYLYSFLYKVVTSSKTIKETEETAQLQVLGEGVVAEFLHRMLNINRTIEVDHVNNEHCLSLPTRPDFSERVKWLLIPLTISLIMQVLFSFVIKRIIINYFLPFMYPLRDRVRLIYFYNKILFLRTTSRTEARSKIRFSATRWKINANKTDRSWLSPRSWFKLKVLDRIFRTGQCIMCETYMKPVKLKYCLDCPATFCKFCVEETGGDCYACMAEDGIVNTEYTMPTIVESLSAIRRNCEENFQDHVQKAYQVI
ncbi:unnamed protein product [Auanema sp. JU1783]|nr:unnamed protein product [Auanema sp. JU1783]